MASLAEYKIVVKATDGLGSLNDRHVNDVLDLLEGMNIDLSLEAIQERIQERLECSGYVGDMVTVEVES